MKGYDTQFMRFGSVFESRCCTKVVSIVGMACNKVSDNPTMLCNVHHLCMNVEASPVT